jgi:lipopolysaccharide heptosyltransferase III
VSAPGSVLVICTRRIGDVLLATPLIRSLARGWPEAAVDALVFEGTEGMLAANPDLREVITVRERAGRIEDIASLHRLWRRYDLAVSVMPGDRPTLYAWAAGRRRVGTLLEDDKNRWKRSLLHARVPFDNLETHTVVMNLRLAELLGVTPLPEVVATWSADDEPAVRGLVPALAEGRPFALLHLFPMFPYKQWHDRGWAELTTWLAARGLDAVVTGGPSDEERTYVDRLLPLLPAGTVNLAGRLSLSQVAFLASRAKAYVGPDTAVTHIAAATGVPVVALYGPSNPVKWGPWPKGHGNANPFGMRGTQTVGNVTLLQGIASCVPCLEEGCERHVRSLSDCLQHLPATRVIDAVERALAHRESHAGE